VSSAIARLSLENGLRDTFAWYLQNEWWWRGVMDGSYQQWIQMHYKHSDASQAVTT
jgi:dTDP-glucose 4,6-dehydratase